MTDQTLPAPATSPWIVGRSQDLLLFIATPVLILVAALALRQGVASKDIQYVVLAFGAMGHNLPGMLRAYGDRVLFARFRTRFVLAPIVLGAICFAFTWRQSSAILLIAYFWAVWHALMQIYGFLRIYDAKVGAVARRFGRLDLAMCLAWFGGAVVFSDARLFYVQDLLASFGVAPLAAASLGTVREVTAGTIAAVSALYLWDQLARRRTGSVSGAKNLLLVTSIAFWWYAHVYTADVLLGLVLFEVFHDVQYLAIVWIYNRRRVATDPGVGAFSRFLFQRSWGMLGLYVGLCLAYGGFIPVTQQWQMSPLAAALTATVIQTSAMLHYYYDGFIWKVRERSTRSGLGIEAGTSSGERTATWHGAKWLLLLLPATLMWVLGEQPPSLAQTRALAESTPRSAVAQLKLGAALEAAGQHAEAVPPLEAALAMTPDDAEVALLLARARFRSGIDLLRKDQAEQARPLLAAAHAHTPALAESAAARGLELWQERDFAGAIAYERAALLMVPSLAIAHLNLALAYRDSGRRDLALAHARQGAALRPGDAKARELVAELERR